MRSFHPSRFVPEAALAGLLASFGAAAAEPVDISKLPSAATTAIEFDRDIKPIFDKACFRCHGPEKPKSRFRLDQREAALKGGDNGVAIIPGKSAESPLIHFAAGLVEDMEMPPSGKGDKLTTAEIGLLRAWIDQGVKYGAPEKPKISFSVTPGFRYVTVQGDERKFREHQWMREGWAGGLERVTIDGRRPDGTKVTAEARALADEQEYFASLKLEKPEIGFLRFGVQQFRRYSDDTGLFYPGYTLPVPELGRDLFVDVGRSWVDVGLTLPDWPKMTIGYEHQYKEGSKSTLQYDYATDSAADPLRSGGWALRPGVRAIDEDVHIVKFDLDHEIQGVRIEDNFRSEFYEQTSDRTRIGSGAASLPSGATGAREREELDHWQAANALRLEKQLRPWLFLSGGYLYSRLDGSAEFTREVFVPVNPAAAVFLDEDTTGVLINQESHVFNANTMLGPWKDLSFTAGLQNEWMRQEGFGSSLIRPALNAATSPTAFNSDLGRMTFDETFGLRYTAIPFTVLHADARFQQESIDHFESNLINDGFDEHHDFFRDVDASSDLREFRGGFMVSPWRQASLGSSYKHREKISDFDFPRDFDRDPVDPGSGYPSFITSRAMESDEVETRLVIRWLAWLRTTLKYQLTSTDYRNETQPFSAGGAPVGGGALRAGNFDTQIWSANVTLNPWRRLHLSTTFSHTDSRLVSAVNNGVELVPYRGDIYSVISSATFALNMKTSWHASYFFSQADYGQGDQPGGLPVGLEYSRHGLLSGITWRLREHLSTKVQYGWFNYSEPSTRHANDYTAHAVFTALTWTLN